MQAGEGRDPKREMNGEPGRKREGNGGSIREGKKGTEQGAVEGQGWFGRQSWAGAHFKI